MDIYFGHLVSENTHNTLWVFQLVQIAEKYNFLFCGRFRIPTKHCVYMRLKILGTFSGQQIIILVLLLCKLKDSQRDVVKIKWSYSAAQQFQMKNLRRIKRLIPLQRSARRWRTIPLPTHDATFQPDIYQLYHSFQFKTCSEPVFVDVSGSLFCFRTFIAAL